MSKIQKPNGEIIDDRRSIWRCNSHEQIAVDMGIIKNELKNTNGLLGNVIDRMEKVDTRCLTHLSNYKEFSQHIAESKKKQSLWGDRRWQMFMFVTACAWAFLFFFIQKEINGQYQHSGNRGNITSDTQQER